MPETQTEIRADHKKWRCNNNVGGKPCGKINDMDTVLCSCGSIRKADDEAIAADGATIGKLYKVGDNLDEYWDYTAPKPL
jgi:hypothetical protein